MNKKNKNGIYLIILVVLIGVYLLVKYVINIAPESNFDMNMLSVDTAQVSGITIIQPKDKNPIKLKNNNGKWQVTQGDKTASADENTLKGIFSTLAEIKIQNLAATGKDKWKEFQLTDSLATEVQLFGSEGKLYKDFFIGKFSYKQNKSPYGQMYRNNVTGLTYVRLNNHDESFIVKGFLPMTFNRDFNNFRNQTLVKLDKNSIDKIVFNYPGDSSFVAEKTDSALWVINQKDTANFKKVDQYLNILKWMRDIHFDDSFSPTQEAAYTIQYSGKNIQPVTIKIYQKDSANYVINSTQNPKAFFDSPLSGTMKQLLKMRQGFL